MVDMCFVISRVFLSVICLSPMTSSIDQDIKNIKIAVLLPEYHTDLSDIESVFRRNLGVPWPYFVQMVMPAIDIANEWVKNKTSIHFTIQSHNSFCRGSNSMIAAVTLKDSYGNDAFFGPACEFSAAPVARFMPLWNKVLITAGALSTGFDFDDKEIDKSYLTRVHGSYTKFANYLLQVCMDFSWKHVVLLYEEYGSNYPERRDCHQCLGAVNAIFVRNNFTIEGYNFILSQADFRTIMEHITTIGRGKYI